MKGLVILSPHVEEILNGTKLWEVRGSNVRTRGTIALIRRGSGLIVGTCDLIDVKGPLSVEELRRNASKACLRPRDIGSDLPYRKTFAWILSNPRRLRKPIPYKHPSGAMIWIKLPDKILSPAPRGKN